MFKLLYIWLTFIISLFPAVMVIVIINVVLSVLSGGKINYPENLPSLISFLNIIKLLLIGSVMGLFLPVFFGVFQYFNKKQMKKATKHGLVIWLMLILAGTSFNIFKGNYSDIIVDILAALIGISLVLKDYKSLKT